MSTVKPAPSLRHYEDKVQNPIIPLVVAILTLQAFAISCVLLLFLPSQYIRYITSNSFTQT